MIKSVQKATRILNVLSQSTQPVSLSNIAASVNENKSTCAHIVSTLEAEGYIVKISRSKGYCLGPASYCLSAKGRYNEDLITLARPIMRYLNNVLGYTVILAVLQADTKYIIDYIDGGEFFEKKSKIKVDDIYRTATGRAILANLPEEKLKNMYDKDKHEIFSQWPEVSSFEDMQNFFCKKNKKGIFEIQEENEGTKGINYGYGIAIYNNLGCVGALGVAVKVPHEKLGEYDAEREKITAVVLRAGKEISRRLKQR